LTRSTGKDEIYCTSRSRNLVEGAYHVVKFELGLFGNAGNDALAVWRRIKTCLARVSFLLGCACLIAGRSALSAQIFKYQQRSAVVHGLSEKSLGISKVS
jgi:hypothetical protein